MGKRSEKKLEYEQTFNEIFGTSIKWSKLSLKELEELARALAERSDDLCRQICKPGAVIAGLIDKIIPEQEQGPVIKIIKGLLAKT